MTDYYCPKCGERTANMYASGHVCAKPKQETIMDEDDKIIWFLAYAAAIVAHESAPADIANKAVLEFHESFYYEGTDHAD